MDTVYPDGAIWSVGRDRYPPSMREKDDEWRVIETLLPTTWREEATTKGAIERTRELGPSELLRLLLFHAVNDAGTKSTAAQAAASGIATISGEALRKRLLTAGDWLAWIAERLSSEFAAARESLPHEFRLRAVDSSTIQGPGAKGTDYRLHYSIDLRSLHCDWHQVTDAQGAELLEQTRVASNDILIGDRNYFRAAGVRPIVEKKAHVLIRLKSQHAALETAKGSIFRVLDYAPEVRVGEVRSWAVRLKPAEDKIAVEGRVIITRLPAPIAQANALKAQRKAIRKQYQIRESTIFASGYFMAFTTIPEASLSNYAALEIYRFRWQIEVAFKRLKQILKLGRLPHKDPKAARAWIQAKLVVALLLEKIYRQRRSFFPWGYDFQRLDS